MNLRVRCCPSAGVCKPLLSVGEYTTMGGVTVLYGDKGYIECSEENPCEKEMRDSQYYGCTVAYKENNVYNIYMKPKGNKTDAMPLSGDSELGDSDDVDGDEAMVPRVPNLPPEPSARQIEHELTGHAVYRSWCRHCVASKGHSSR